MNVAEGRLVDDGGPGREDTVAVAELVRTPATGRDRIEPPRVAEDRALRRGGDEVIVGRPGAARFRDAHRTRRYHRPRAGPNAHRPARRSLPCEHRRHSGHERAGAATQGSGREAAHVPAAEAPLGPPGHRPQHARRALAAPARAGPRTRTPAAADGRLPLLLRPDD